jgi:hypothetical protein
MKDSNSTALYKLTTHLCTVLLEQYINEWSEDLSTQEKFTK